MIRILLFCGFITLVAGQSNCTVGAPQVSLTNGKSNGITELQISAMLNSMNNTFVDSTKMYFSCLTELTTTGILGAAGGDSGEFVIALAALDYFGGNTTSSSISSMIQSFITSLRQNSPDRTLHYPIELSLLNTLANSTGLSLNSTTFTQITNITVQNTLLDAMTNKSNFLSIFLNDLLKLTESDTGYVKPDIVKNFARAAFTLIWNGNNSLVHASFYTKGKPNALVNFGSNSSSRCHSYAPLIVPIFNSSFSIYVEHLGFIDIFRDLLSANLSSILNNVNSSTFRQRYDGIASDVYDIFLALHASSIPQFSATYTVTDTTVVSLTTSGSSVMTSGMLTSGAIMNSTTTTSSTMGSATVSGGKAWVGILIVFILLAVFLGGTYIAWTQYRKIFGTHNSHGRSAAPTSPKKTPSRNESDLVPLDEIGSGYGYGGGYGSHDREEQL